MKIESQNHELAQANQLLITQVADKEKSVIDLQNKNAQLTLKTISQQKLSEKLILKIKHHLKNQPR